MALKVKEIADMLKVSPATVSLVLNNRPGVSDETRQRVMKLVEEMGYNTNALSKPALKNNRNIRFVIYKKHGKVMSDTPFFSALIEGIEEEARDDGYNLIVSYVNEQENMMDTIRIINDNPSEGILLLATEMLREDIEKFLQLKHPLVILDNNLNLPGTDTVAIDNVTGVKEVIDYLTVKGHQNIGYLRSSTRIANFNERQLGFLSGLDEAGIEMNTNYTFDLEPTLEGAYNDTKKLLSVTKDLPSALFADNDIIAFGAIKAFKEAGVRVPEDLSIIGFDDMPFCEMIEPALTTARVFKQRMGRLAVKRLIERIEHPITERIKILIQTELIERKSVINKSVKK